MINQLPVKSLVKVNWIISLMCSVVIFTFLFSTTRDLGLELRFSDVEVGPEETLINETERSGLSLFFDVYSPQDFRRS